jgi:cytochrome c peroxidase
MPPVAALGKQIFFDASLSASGKLACSTCHDPKRAYGPPPGKAIALGGKDMTQSGTRAVPSLRYLRASPAFSLEHRFIDGDMAPVGGFTWDGRATSIKEQAQLPLLAANEMANLTPANVVRKLEKAHYATQFRAAFGADIFKDPMRAFAAALQALDEFQSTPSEFFPYTSRYDAFLHGDVELTEQEERGAALFKDPKKGNCASCHLSSSRGGKPPMFTDYDFAHVGVPRNPDIPVNADPNYYDRGLCGPDRSDLKDKQEYCGFFRAPTLRNVAIRDAFFHNGAFHTMRDTLLFYVQRDLKPERFYPHNPDGSIRKADDQPAGSPDTLETDPPFDRHGSDAPALSDNEIEDVIAFLKTLTDADVGQADGAPAASHSALQAPPASAPAARTPAIATGLTDHPTTLPQPLAPPTDSTSRPTPSYVAPHIPTAALDWAHPYLQLHNAELAVAHSDEYAWRLFVALNWPANPSTRAADPTTPLGADQPVVWEAWQNAEAVYLDDGRDPGPWASNMPLPAVADEARFEALSLKDVPNARHIVGGKMVPVTDPLANARRLTEIRMNQPAFAYIRSRELYNLDGQLRAVSTGANINFPAASTEIKAKWRPIRADERARYHTLEVKFADGTQHLYGLTALHIVSKDLPQWFWTTFEHADNPTLPGGDGWQLPSSDHFACSNENTACNRPPRGIGLEGTVWENYRLRGTLTRFIDDANRPGLLANSELEAGMQQTSSCMTCHARSALGIVAGEPTRLPIFDMAMRSTNSATGQGSAAPLADVARRGFIGTPNPEWFAPATIATGPAVATSSATNSVSADATRPVLFHPLDFVWSLSKARPRKVPHET